MGKSFKMGWSKVTYYNVVFVVTITSPLIFFALVDRPCVGIPLLVFTLFMVWLQYQTFRHSRYLVDGNEITVQMFWTKPRRYEINRILRIDYIDTGTDWVGRYPPNTRHQVAILFERKYVKSVTPFRFGPADRDGFVKAVLESNPAIVVDCHDTRVKPNRYNIG